MYRIRDINDITLTAATTTATTTTTTTTTTTIGIDSNITTTTTTSTPAINTIVTGYGNTNNDDDDDDDEDDEDFTQTDYYQHNLQNSSRLSPLLVVLDFDHTLAVSDLKYFLDKNALGIFPSIYTRPFLYNFLDFIKSVNKNNILILWTAGTEFYINHALLLLDIAQYFDHVLSRKHCDESKQNFGKKKSYQFLAEKFPQYCNMRSVIVDNFGIHNSARTGFSQVISIKPFNLTDIIRGLGAFNVHPINISDESEFIMSKGKLGFSKDFYFLIDTESPYYGDTTLLNLIKYMNREFFLIPPVSTPNTTTTTTTHDNNSILISTLYCISDNGSRLTISKKKIDRQHQQQQLNITDFAMGEPVMFCFDDNI